MKLLIIFIILYTNIISQDVKIVVGDQLPPYIIEAYIGFEFDIIDTVFNNTIHRPIYTFVPFGRLSNLIGSPDFDAFSSAYSFDNIKGYHLSDPYIYYDNILVGLKEKKIEINAIEDLLNYSIIAFLGAKDNFGDKFFNITNKNKSYREVSNQEGQVASLFNKRVDLILIDRYIFQYYFKNSQLNFDKELEFVIYDVFEKTPYSIAFKNINVRDNFNKGLKLIKENGEYDQIIKSYLDNF